MDASIKDDNKKLVELINNTEIDNENLLELLNTALDDDMKKMVELINNTEIDNKNLLELLNKAKDKVIWMQQNIDGGRTRRSNTNNNDSFNAPSGNKRQKQKQRHQKSEVLIKSISEAIGLANKLSNKIVRQEDSKISSINNKNKIVEINNVDDDENLLGLLDKSYKSNKEIALSCGLNLPQVPGNPKFDLIHPNKDLTTEKQQQRQTSELIHQVIKHAIASANNLVLPSLESYHYLTPQRPEPARRRYFSPDTSFDEYKLVIRDDSCTTLRHIFNLLKDRYLIWITPNACALYWNFEDEERVPNFVIPNDYYCIWAKTNKGCLCAIYGKTEADTASCLEYLLALPTTTDEEELDRRNAFSVFCKAEEIYFDDFTFSGGVHQYVDVIRAAEEQWLRCPIDHARLEAALCCTSPTRRQREYKFMYTIFTAPQSYVLAKAIMTGGISIRFRSCKFEDEGKAFADAFCNHRPLSSVARGTTAKPTGDDGDSPTIQERTKLQFDQNFTRAEPPFHQSHWNRFVTSEGLSDINLHLKAMIFPPEFCDGFKNCTAKRLCLRDYDNTGGKVLGSLAEAIRHNRGPRDIDFQYEFGDGGDVDGNDFLEVLGNDEHGRVKKLHIEFAKVSLRRFDLNGRKTQCIKLLNSLQSNRSLERLEIMFPQGNRISREWDDRWSKVDIFVAICDSIQDHPTLSSIKFSTCYNIIAPMIKVLLKLLEKNKVLEDIIVPFDSERFRKKITPLLTLNKYRKLFHRYRTYDLQTATLSTALARISRMDNPSLLFMLVCDTIGCNSNLGGDIQQQKKQNNYGVVDENKSAAKRPRYE